MSIPTRILLLLIGLRLLLPPGICLCKYTSPVAQLLTRAMGTEPVDVADDHDDHHPGCPASFLALGLGVKPPNFEGITASMEVILIVGGDGLLSDEQELYWIAPIFDSDRSPFAMPGRLRC